MTQPYKTPRFIASLVVFAGIAAGIAASPASAAVIDVTPANLDGWAFSNLDNSPNTDASGGFEFGPGSAPLGIGSAQSWSTLKVQ